MWKGLPETWNPPSWDRGTSSNGTVWRKNPRTIFSRAVKKECVQSSPSSVESQWSPIVSAAVIGWTVIDISVSQPSASCLHICLSIRRWRIQWKKLVKNVLVDVKKLDNWPFLKAVETWVWKGVHMGHRPQTVCNGFFGNVLVTVTLTLQTLLAGTFLLGGMKS